MTRPGRMETGSGADSDRLAADSPALLRELQLMFDYIARAVPMRDAEYHTRREEALRVMKRVQGKPHG